MRRVPVPVVLGLFALSSVMAMLYRIHSSAHGEGASAWHPPKTPVSETWRPEPTTATTSMATMDSFASTPHQQQNSPPRVIELPPRPPDPQPAPLSTGALDPAHRSTSKRSHGKRTEDIVVGLNKAVYKYEKQRAYECPALGGGGCVFTTERSRFGEAHALIDVLKDARKAAALDFRVKAGQFKGVIISEKDEAKASSGAFRANAYDFEVGYNKRTATIWRPFMCNEVSRKTNLTIAEVVQRGDPRRRPPFEQGLNGRVWPAVTGELAAFVSNCVGWRLEYLRELRKHVAIDSFGACLHNNDSCAKAGKHKCDKVVLAGAYKFVFAFENTEESHYVTEKVYTGLRSGAVPIYKGAPEILQHVPGARSVLLADKFGSAAALGAHLRKLLDDEHAYEEHHRWDLEEFGRSEAVAQCPWQCRVCEWIAAARHQEHGAGGPRVSTRGAAAHRKS
jgi:hypothetical protein